MPVDLHERLSEFSYGYGLTREVEQRLQGMGLSAVPFFPNLQHEAQLGFDVGFNLPGVPLLLQFKLGQAMRRFPTKPRPRLATRYWRFKVNTAEPGGQYDLLLNAAQDGAEVYYAAPKFHDWTDYLNAFEDGELIAESLFVTPGEVDRVMTRHGVVPGEHKIAYDHARAYLCSEPHRIRAVGADEIATKVRTEIERTGQTLASRMDAVLAGFSTRAPLEVTDDLKAVGIPSDAQRSRERRRRLARFRERTKSRDEAVAATVGAEAWAVGAQMLMVTLP